MGILSHYSPLAAEQTDMFGQAPIHLASLRGNTEVVEYLLIDCHSDPLKKDKNGQLPLDIAIKKQHFRTELAIRKYMYPDLYSLMTMSLNNFYQCT